MNIRDWLLHCAKDEIFSFDMTDFEHDCDEILKDYAEVEDPVVECDNRRRLWELLRAWQRDKEYLSSLNLHRVIAKHVRISCRAVQCDDVCLESWVEKKSARLVGLADKIAIEIRAAWKVHSPLKPEAVPKFSEALSLDSLDKFHLGLEELIGYPPTHLDFLELMKQEHEGDEKFADREGREVDPKVEWNIVMKGTAWSIQGADVHPTTKIKNRRCSLHLDHYIQEAKRKFAKANASESGTLNEAEVAALRLWTGPMHRKYADVLRHPQKLSGPYVTTLHAINSGITKLARIWPLPANRKVFRGYKDLRLEDLQKDTFNCVGGVEKCVLATSEDFAIAVDYSVNESKVGAFILEIDVGQVNRGADVSWLSQFPHEKEILFNALSNVEFVRSPEQRFVEGRGTILVYQVFVSANVKGKTLDEFIRLRRDLHLNLYQEARRIIYVREEGSRNTLIKNLGAECRKHCDAMLRKAEAADVGIFNKRTPSYVSLEEDAIMLPKRSFDIMDLVLHWFETRKADPAEVYLLQDWQLQALRTSFKSNERPEVTTIVLEQDYHVASLFSAKSLTFDKRDTVHRVAKLLSLNPELESLTMEDVSAKAKLADEFGLCRPGPQVHGFHLATYAIRTLQQLEFRNLGYEIAALIPLALLIHPPNALISLSLWGSPIACAGAESLGRAFSGLQRLRYVDLRSCQIASRGCTGISRNLSGIAELEELNLAYNQVCDDGFRVLADAIRTLQLETLKSVDMRHNNIKSPSLQFGPQCVMKNDIVWKSRFSAYTDFACVTVAWSQLGNKIASASFDGSIIIQVCHHDLTSPNWTGGVLSHLTLKGHAAPVTSVTWNRSRTRNQVASGSRDETIIIWDLNLNANTGKQIFTLKGHTETVTCVDWCPRDDLIASASDDKTIIVWDAMNGARVSILMGHSGEVNSVAWDPRGNLLASASSDTTIIIWDAKTGAQVSTLQGHEAKVTSVAWHPWGNQIASGSDDKTIIIWDADSDMWKMISRLNGHSDCVKSVTWSPEGDKIASGSEDQTIIVWNATTGLQVSIMKGHTSAVTSVAWNPFLSYQIASSSRDGAKIIWNVTTGDQILDLTETGSTSRVMSVTWSPGADQIASNSNTDYTVIIWNAETGEKVSTLKGHTDWVTDVDWSSGGDQIASGSADTTIIIWDAQTGLQVSTLKGHTRVTSVAWQQGGDQIASASYHNTIIIWDSKTGEQVFTLKGHSSSITSVAWRPGGDQIASGSRDNTVIIWDAKNGEQVSTLKGHTSWVESVAWRPGGDQIVSGGYGAGRYPGDESAPGEIIIWDAKTGHQVSNLKGHTAAVTSVGWRPGVDQLASASHDKIVMIWGAKTGKQISTLKGHACPVMRVAWCPRGDQIASASDDQPIIIWDANLKTGDHFGVLKGHARAVNSVVWSPGGDQIASGSNDRNIIIQDAMTGENILILEGHRDHVRSVAWSPGGDQIVSGSDDNSVIIWDTKSGVQIFKLKGHAHYVTSVAWRPGGDQIASGSADTMIIIWDANIAKLGGDPEIFMLKGHNGMVSSVAWSPGGDLIASGSWDNTIIVWDAKTGSQISMLTGHTDRVTSVAWNPLAGSNQIASGSWDKSTIIWDVKTSEKVSTLKGHTDCLESVAWHPKANQIASASEDMTIIIWDAKTGHQVSKLEGHTDKVKSVAWCPGCDRIASASEDTTVAIWNLNTSKHASTLKVPSRNNTVADSEIQATQLKALASMFEGASGEINAAHGVPLQSHLAVSANASTVTRAALRSRSDFDDVVGNDDCGPGDHWPATFKKKKTH